MKWKKSFECLFNLFSFQLLEKIKNDFFFWLPGSSSAEEEKAFQVSSNGYATQQATVGSKSAVHCQKHPSLSFRRNRKEKKKNIQRSFDACRLSF